MLKRKGMDIADKINAYLDEEDRIREDGTGEHEVVHAAANNDDDDDDAFFASLKAEKPPVVVIVDKVDEKPIPIKADPPVANDDQVTKVVPNSFSLLTKEQRCLEFEKFIEGCAPIAFGVPALKEATVSFFEKALYKKAGDDQALSDNQLALTNSLVGSVVDHGRLKGSVVVYMGTPVKRSKAAGTPLKAHNVCWLKREDVDAFVCAFLVVGSLVDDNSNYAFVPVPHSFAVVMFAEVPLDVITECKNIITLGNGVVCPMVPDSVYSKKQSKRKEINKGVVSSSTAGGSSDAHAAGDTGMTVLDKKVTEHKKLESAVYAGCPVVKGASKFRTVLKEECVGVVKALTAETLARAFVKNLRVPPESDVDKGYSSLSEDEYGFVCDPTGKDDIYNHESDRRFAVDDDIDVLAGMAEHIKRLPMGVERLKVQLEYAQMSASLQEDKKIRDDKMKRLMIGPYADFKKIRDKHCGELAFDFTSIMRHGYRRVVRSKIPVTSINPVDFKEIHLQKIADNNRRVDNAKFARVVDAVNAKNDAYFAGLNGSLDWIEMMVEENKKKAKKNGKKTTAEKKNNLTSKNQNKHRTIIPLLKKKRMSDIAEYAEDDDGVALNSNAEDDDYDGPFASALASANKYTDKKKQHQQHKKQKMSRDDENDDDNDDDDNDDDHDQDDNESNSDHEDDGEDDDSDAEDNKKGRSGKGHTPQKSSSKPSSGKSTGKDASGSKSKGMDKGRIEMMKAELELKIETTRKERDATSTRIAKGTQRLETITAKVKEARAALKVDEADVVKCEALVKDLSNNLKSYDSTIETLKKKMKELESGKTAVEKPERTAECVVLPDVCPPITDLIPSTVTYNMPLTRPVMVSKKTKNEVPQEEFRLWLVGEVRQHIIDVSTKEPGNECAYMEKVRRKHDNTFRDRKNPDVAQANVSKMMMPLSSSSKADIMEGPYKTTFLLAGVYVLMYDRTLMPITTTKLSSRPNLFDMFRVFCLEKERLAFNDRFKQWTKALVERNPEEKARFALLKDRIAYLFFLMRKLMDGTTAAKPIKPVAKVDLSDDEEVEKTGDIDMEADD